MDICRLCLQPGPQNITNSEKILDTLKNFLPYMNSSLKLLKHQFCDICLQNIDTIADLNASINETNKEILSDVEKSNGQANCRVCSKIVYEPQIFLYKNEFNLFRHDLIFKMLEFCQVTLNCDLCEKPVMCLQCWEKIQVCYTLKKNYLEIDKKITTYCSIFKLTPNDITDQVIQKMRQYFLEHENIDTEVIKNEQFICDNTRYSLRKRIKKEYINDIPEFKRSNMPNVKGEEHNGQVLPKRPRHSFTIEEDELLLKTYFKLKNNDTCVGFPLWKKIQQECKKNLSTEIKTRSISARVKRILANKSKNSIYKKLTQRKVVQKPSNTIVNIFPSISNDQMSDSDDSFVDEVAPSSFMPIIKPEPLSDNEIHVIESNIEPDLPPSATDSDDSLPLPLLERMDLNPLNLKIQEIYSVNVKRETLEESNEDFRTFKDHNNEKIYKCMKCNFETKYHTSAIRHSNWHANPMKKGFECIHCSFVTSKYFLLKHHLSTNHEDNMDNDDSNDDIPILIPFTV